MIILGIVLVALAGLIHFAILSAPAAFFTVGVVLILLGLLQRDVFLPPR